MLSCSKSMQHGRPTIDCMAAVELSREHCASIARPAFQLLGGVAQVQDAVDQPLDVTDRDGMAAIGITQDSGNFTSDIADVDCRPACRSDAVELGGNHQPLEPRPQRYQMQVWETKALAEVRVGLIGPENDIGQAVSGNLVL